MTHLLKVKYLTFQATRIAYGARRYRVVTLNGDLIETSGAMAGGGREKMHGKMGTQVSRNINNHEHLLFRELK